jgi:hypothetical protein
LFEQTTKPNLNRKSVIGAVNLCATEAKSTNLLAQAHPAFGYDHGIPGIAGIVFY